MHIVHVQVVRAGTSFGVLHYRALHVYALGMEIETPATIPGPALAEQRRGYGVTRRALADQLGLHRNTLRAWETAHAVDVLRQRRYLAALQTIVDAATGVPA